MTARSSWNAWWLPPVALAVACGGAPRGDGTPAADGGAPPPCEPPAAPLETLPVRSTDASYTLRDYNDECRAALGEIPAFNCYDGREIAVHVTRGDPVNALGEATGPGTTMPVRSTADLENGVACDRPFGIGLASANGRDGRDTSCVPHSRIGIAYGRDRHGHRTEFVYICRTYFFREPDGRGRLRFDDLGYIGHNPTTGATCFWAVPINENPPGRTLTRDTSFEGDPVPRPGEGGGFWKSFGSLARSRCMTCHSNDPYISTPIVQATGVLPSHPRGPYWAVAGDRLNALAGQDPEGHWNVGRHLVAEPAGPCTSCHRLTPGLIGAVLAPDAAGLTKLRSTGAVYARVYPYAVWMSSFDHAELLAFFPTRARWEERFFAAASLVRACARDPDGEDCAWAPVSAPVCCELPDGSHRALAPDDCSSRSGEALPDPSICRRPTCGR